MDDGLLSLMNDCARERSYSAYSALANGLDAAGPARSGLTPLKVAVLRNFTVDPLIPVIKGEIALAGFHPEVWLGGFDAIAADVFDPGSGFYGFAPDIVIMAQWLESLSPALSAGFASLPPGGAAAESERVISAVSGMLAAIRARTKAPVVINNFPLPEFPAFGILDGQSEEFQSHTVLRLNLEMLRAAKSLPGIYCADYLGVFARVGSAEGVDERYWQIGRAPLGRKSVVQLGREYGRLLAALTGKAKKCLVTDCDNVLWGGIVGEDGPEKIVLGESYPGSCYRALQREMLGLHDRGVILALCSKNNEADVLEVFAGHPGMLLKESHFACRRINWDDKASNLRSIAAELNIGLDSLVFVDDSPFECGLVREQLPQVSVIELSGDASGFRSKLRAGGCFDSLVFSDEDRRRTALYREEAERRKIMSSASSLEEYLGTLELRAQACLADAASIPRIAQLTQKTNQFNLTTRRYTEGEIGAIAQDPDAGVFYIRASDKVADMGIVGVAIARRSGETARIDSFLLSCRAIGRGIEQALLSALICWASGKGCRRASAMYIASKKNGQVADFWERHGFARVGGDSAGSQWEVEIASCRVAWPLWIKKG